MPTPAVYVLAIVGAVAAGFAFKEFVYEPHIAPKIEQWAEEFIANREARRRQKVGAVPVSVPAGNDDDETTRSKHSDFGDEGSEARQSIELENLIAKEVREWQNEVNRSQTQLRRRGNAGPSKASTAPTNRNPIMPTSPTHVLFDPSLPSTPSSTLLSVEASPSPRVSSLRETSSHSTALLLSAPPIQAPGRLPTPAPSSNTSPGPPRAPLSPSSIPSLSQTYPQDLDHEHGLELLSAPSSRPDSPYSSFSQPLSAIDSVLSNSNYYSFSSPNAASPPPNISSPQVRPPSRSSSDLDFLSDFDEQDPTSPRSSTSGISSFDEVHLDDGMRSDSGWSWASAGARNRSR